MIKRKAIGIDLGTTFSVVGVKADTDQGIDIITLKDGQKTMASYVHFKEDGQVLVGNEAKRNLSRFPKQVIYDAKRLIGKYWDDIKDTYESENWSFQVKQVKQIVKPYEQDLVVVVPGMGEFRPEDISALILCELKHEAETYLGYEVKDAVVTVPAYFNNAQRNATRLAGELADLNITRIINEPTAAALAYGLDTTVKQTTNSVNATNINQTSTHDPLDDFFNDNDNDDDDYPESKLILVADIGGGTTDYSLLSITNGLFEVVATAGNSHLGGQDFDNALMKFCLKEFSTKHRLSKCEPSGRAMNRLRQACENAKKILSTSQETTINVETLCNDMDMSVKLTRARFNNLCDSLFQQVISPIDQVLMDAKVSKFDVEDIVMVGGSSRIPQIQTLIQNKFEGKQLCVSINPDECVAFGASVQASILNNRNTNGNSQEDPFSNVLLSDVTPLTLGIETDGGIMCPIIHRNTKIPTDEVVHKFTTVTDNETEVTISIYEGERPLTKHNQKLGEFDLTGITQGPRGTPRIEVIFEIDTDGILSIKARESNRRTIDSNLEEEEKNKHNSQPKYTELKITRQHYTPKSVEELDEKLEDATKHEEEDEITRQKLEIQSKFQTLLQEISSILNDQGIKMKFSSPNSDTPHPFIKKITDWYNEVDDWFKSQDDLEQISLDTYKEFYEVAKDDKKKFDGIIYKRDDSTISSETYDQSLECQIDSEYYNYNSNT